MGVWEGVGWGEGAHAAAESSVVARLSHMLTTYSCKTYLKVLSQPVKSVSSQCWQRCTGRCLAQGGTYKLQHAALQQGAQICPLIQQGAQHHAATHTWCGVV